MLTSKGILVSLGITAKIVTYKFLGLGLQSDPGGLRPVAIYIVLSIPRDSKTKVSPVIGLKISHTLPVPTHAELPPLSAPRAGMIGLSQLMNLH